jgi:transcriptional regulator with XRE-family HTH domain
VDTDFPPSGVFSSEVPASDIFNSHLGQRLRSLREAFGLSQRELAKRAGVTNSNISMIEQGQISPSVQSLDKILNAFPISLAEFFSSQLMSERSPVVTSIEIAANAHPVADGVIAQRLQKTGLTQQPFLSRIIFQPNTSSLMKLADTNLSGWVITGELDLYLANQIYKINAGGGFFIGSQQAYRLANSLSSSTELMLASLSTYE